MKSTPTTHVLPTGMLMENNRLLFGRHVDDCKLSCVNVKVQDKFIEVLRQEYESIFEDGSGKMTVQ